MLIVKNMNPAQEVFQFLNGYFYFVFILSLDGVFPIGPYGPYKIETIAPSRSPHSVSEILDACQIIFS